MDVSLADRSAKMVSDGSYLFERHQSIEGDGSTAIAVSRAVPAIWHHATARCIVSWSSRNRYVVARSSDVYTAPDTATFRIGR